MDSADLAGVFDNTGADLDLSGLLSRLPSDFNNRQKDFYFTPSYAVAEVYRRFVRRRRCSFGVVISFRIPNAAIESVTGPAIQRIYWPAPEWKQLIWHCRRGDILPSHLVKYKIAILVIGTISKRPSSFYLGLRFSEDITAGDLFMVCDEVRGAYAGVQYVFSGRPDGQDFLLRNGFRDTVQILSSPPDGLEDW